MLKTVKDQLNRTIKVPKSPKRIISLVPSQTELLYYLGLRDEVIGITKFCVHPKEWFTSKTRIGGTKQYKFDKINYLAPDLIIGNKEENDKTQIEALAQQYPVWLSDIKTLEDAFQMILNIGILIQKENRASALVERLRKQFSKPSMIKPRKVAYFIWQKPFMVAANDTFIHEMLRVAGFINIFEHLSRYPEITLAQLAMAQPEVILLSSEPYPFKQKHIKAFKEACPTATVLLVNGEIFSWYGSRLLHGRKYLEQLRTSLE